MIVDGEAAKLVPKVRRRLRQLCVEAVTHRIATLPPELRNLRALDSALDLLPARWPPSQVTDPWSESPIFLFSAGWRSGSTLLQRLICSSGDNIIWGEPLGDAAIIPRMATSLVALSNDYPPDSYFTSPGEQQFLSGEWIANLTPPIDALRSAHRAFFREWLAVPGQQRYGVRRWGFKEVRLTIQHARYLKWLFPAARFVFIYRNLNDAYLSWRGNLWASSWPGYYSWSPIAYARHWQLLLSGFLDGHRAVDGHLVRYEDLIAGSVDLEELAEYLGVGAIDPAVLDRRIGSPDEEKRQRRRKRLTTVEKLLLQLVAGDTPNRAGYK